MNKRINGYKATAVTVVVIAAVGSAVYEARRAARLERTLEALQRQPPEPTLVAAPPRQEPPVLPGGQSNRSAQVFGWQQVEASDYRQYIANLRAIGCPEETIQDIVVADVNKLYASRAKAVRAASTNAYEYWKPRGSGFGSLLNEEMTVNMQELASEKKALLTQLLGVAMPDRLEAWPAGMNPFELMLDFLPADKQAKAMEIEQQLTVRMAQTAREIAKGDYVGRDRAYSEREAQLAALFTPEEKFEYDLRMSPSAQILRNRLGSFEPTEEEFREMVRLQRRFDAEFGLPRERRTPDEEAHRRAGKEALDAWIRTLLGDRRYSEFKAEARREW
jgi:hypothetical protein